MTDPSYAGQLITFTYPQIGNYGTSAEAMESDRVHARAAIMRAAVDHTDAPGSTQGWLSWLAGQAVPAITDVDTRALVRHIRDQGAMRGGVFPAALSEQQARDLIEQEPDMAGRDLVRDVTPNEPIVVPGKNGDDRVGGILNCDDRHRREELDRPQPDRARRHRRAPPLHGQRERPPPQRPGRDLPRQRPRRPGIARLHRANRAPPDRQAPGVRHLPRPSAAVPRGRPRDLQAAVRPPRREPSGQGPDDRRSSRSPARTTASRSSVRTGPGRSTATRRCGGRPTSAPPS